MGKYVLLSNEGLFVKHDWNISDLVNDLEDATMFLNFEIAESFRNNIPKYNDFDIKEVLITYKLI